MKRYIGFIVLLAALTLSAASCSDLLNIDQHGVVSVDTYYSTDAEIETASSNLYIKMRSLEGSTILLKPLLDGDFWAGGGQHGDNSGMDKIAEYTFDSEDGTIGGYFKGLYNLIFAANTILDKVDPGFSSVAKRTVAEAQVFRAWAYFELISMWGTPPLVDHCLQPDEYKQPNGDPAALWALVNNDLQAAISSGALPEKNGVNDKSVWRVSKQYAQAIYGKALLWQGKNAEAAQVLDQVIGSGKYQLFDGEYGDRNTMANKFNCENIFESVFPNDPANPVVSFTGYMLGWRTDRMNPDGISAWGIEMGFGFCAPTKKLYDDFLAHDGHSYRLQQSIKSYEEMVEMGLGLITDAIQMGEGVYMWKDRYTRDKTPAMWCTAKNFTWMRLAEVYLVAAEAHLAAGNTAKATEYVNQIRRKAQIPELTSVSLNDIKAEKRFELCREGTLYQDLQRWGDTYEKLKDVGQKEPIFHENGTITYFDCGNPADKCGYKKGKHELLPFPANEVRLNDQIVQNPGY